MAPGEEGWKAQTNPQSHVLVVPTLHSFSFILVHFKMEHYQEKYLNELKRGSK